MGIRGPSCSCFNIPLPLFGALDPANCPPDGTFGEIPPVGLEGAEMKMNEAII